LIGVGAIQAPIKYLHKDVFEDELSKPQTEDIPASSHPNPNKPPLSALTQLPDAGNKAPKVADIFPRKINIIQIFQDFKDHFPPHWRWVHFSLKGFKMGSVLMSAELVEIPKPSLSVMPVETTTIPKEISPNMKKFRIECLFVGIRKAQQLKLPKSTIGRYKIELSIGDLVLYGGISGKIQNRNFNFLDPYASNYLVRIS
jgi:hypothetical protein